MSELTRYQITFEFDEPSVADAREFYERSLKRAHSNAIPSDFKDHFGALKAQGYWSTILPSLQVADGRSVTTFRFNSSPKSTNHESIVVVEEACFDMFGWLRMVSLTRVEPVVVELRKFGDVAEREDYTIEARGFLLGLQWLDTAQPIDFKT